MEFFNFQVCDSLIKSDNPLTAFGRSVVSSAVSLANASADESDGEAIIRLHNRIIRGDIQERKVKASEKTIEERKPQFQKLIDGRNTDKLKRQITVGCNNCCHGDLCNRGSC